MKLMITETVHPAGIKMLEKYLEVDCNFQITREELKEKIKDYDEMDSKLIKKGEII